MQLAPVYKAKLHHSPEHCNPSCLEPNHCSSNWHLTVTGGEVLTVTKHKQYIFPILKHNMTIILGIECCLETFQT
jgi:hypothetical protein